MATDQTEIIDRVSVLMKDLFDRDDLIIDESTTAEDVDEWDSLSHIRLMVAIEKHYKVRFSTTEIESLQNVGDLVNLIDRKTGS
jgi:acyl carrier protein